MSEHHPIETEASPTGEHIHMPAPSILPVLNAVGLALTIVGITEGFWILIPGAVLFLITAVVWIRSAVRETAELPLEHHH